jgi:hypothetical protein
VMEQGREERNAEEPARAPPLAFLAYIPTRGDRRRRRLFRRAASASLYRIFPPRPTVLSSQEARAWFWLIWRRVRLVTLPCCPHLLLRCYNYDIASLIDAVAGLIFSPAAVPLSFILFSFVLTHEMNIIYAVKTYVLSMFQKQWPHACYCCLIENVYNKCPCHLKSREKKTTPSISF